MFKNIKRTKIAKDVFTLLYYQTTVLVFSSYGEEIKTFCQSFEAIDYAFARKNYQLLKIIFQNTQKMMVQKIFPYKARKM